MSEDKETPRFKELILLTGKFLFLVGIKSDFVATHFRRDKQKDLTVNTVNLMIKH
ncbi:MAG: hypothetical protein WCS87_12280 [Methylococcaceae bacterium]